MSSGFITLHTAEVQGSDSGGMTVYVQVDKILYFTECAYRTGGGGNQTMKLDLDAEAVIIEAFGLVESPMQDSTGFTICSFPGEISPAAVMYARGGSDGWTLPLTGRKPHAAWHLGVRLLRLYGDSGSDAFEIPPFSSIEELRLKLEATRR